MDRLWAPWRLHYVTTAAAAPKASVCFLCDGVAASDDRGNLIVHRGPHSAVFLNLYPYNNGHLLVAPLAHKSTLAELNPDELLDLQLVVRRCVAVLQDRLNPDGFNVGLNLGRSAGAGLPGHLHWHVVPRWNGDTNFMPVLGDAKVISQSLEALYELLAGQLD